MAFFAVNAVECDELQNKKYPFSSTRTPQFYLILRSFSRRFIAYTPFEVNLIHLIHII